MLPSRSLWIAQNGSCLIGKCLAERTGDTEARSQWDSGVTADNQQFTVKAIRTSVQEGHHHIICVLWVAQDT